MFKKTDFKTLMFVAILVTSLIGLPTMVLGQEEGEEGGGEESDQAGAFEGFHGGFGGIFSENLGYGGELIGRLFELLLLDGVDLENEDEGDGVYVLSASDTEVYTGSYDFEAEYDTEEIHYLPFVDYLNASVAPFTKYWHYNDNQSDYNVSNINGQAYCKVEKEGGFDYDLAVGAALTLIIWDYDGAFIEAAEKVLN